MPYSHPAHYPSVVNLIRTNFPSNSTRILDVGVGSGTYRNLLPEYTMDGIEVYSKYIQDFNLESRYRKIFNVDVVDFEFNANEYELVIMGDVLEHLSVVDALNVLKSIKDSGMSLLIQVPYMYEQGIYDGNDHEIHLPSDLTHDVFLDRYSEFGFELLNRDDVCGAYYTFNKK